MKVYIVLEYFSPEYFNRETMEKCRVDRVYRNLYNAQDRVNYLESKKYAATTFHIITKTLKGKPLP